MAWIGYYTLGGIEVINAARTEAYAKNAGLGWFKPVIKNDSLALMLGETYSSPLQDDAPWTDPDDPASYDFFGFYPLEITGIEDSTGSATITESTLDGGIVGRIRRTTRTMVFSGVLVAASECGAEYGMRWLRSALVGGACIGRADQACGGTDLCFLSCEPTLDFTINPTPTPDLTDCLDDFTRSLHSVTVITGPSITQKMTPTIGGEAWAIQFTAVAGNPYEFGIESPLVRGFMDPNVEIPYVGGLPAGATFDPDGFIQQESDCPVVTYQPVFDPLCPLVLPPPAVPSVSLSCFDFPVNYRRRSFTIPKQNVPLWGDVVPIVSIHARTKEVRSLRLRFYADVAETGDPNDDPCNFCGDIVFSFIPEGSTIVFDGTDKIIYIEDETHGRRRADSLVFGSDGNPFEWPELSCGFGYVVTVDLPQTATAPVVDLTLVSRVV